MSNFVIIGRKNVEDALEWAKKNCPNYITTTYHPTEYLNNYEEDRFNFFFSDSDQGRNEMAWFSLRWV
jgi:hypothetical protein